MTKVFNHTELKKLFKPKDKSSGEENGQVTIIGGSELFHGAPLLALKVASRIVDMVFFTSPQRSVGGVAERLKSKLLSFIWVPWEDTDAYIEKSDAVLIGPGLMRFTSESQNPNGKIPALPAGRQMANDEEGKRTRETTKKFLKKFPNKRWVIDAGSLQVIEPDILPEGCIVTPNRKEFELLFNERVKERESKRVEEIVKKKAEHFSCTIVLKGPETIVASPEEAVIVKGGNPGLTKGGTGDVLAGLTSALLAKNDPFLAASSASYIEKAAADELYKKVGTNYNADDLANQIPETFKNLLE